MRRPATGGRRSGMGVRRRESVRPECYSTTRAGSNDGYAGCLRDCRWASTFRFTRWRALSTVFGSQPMRSPIAS